MLRVAPRRRDGALAKNQPRDPLETVAKTARSRSSSCQPRSRETQKRKHTMAHLGKKASAAADWADSRSKSRVTSQWSSASVLRRRIRDGHWPVGAKHRHAGGAGARVSMASPCVSGAPGIDSVAGRGAGEILPGPRTPRHRHRSRNDRRIQLATDWDSLGSRSIRDNVPHLPPSATQPAPPSIEDGDGPRPTTSSSAASRKRGSQAVRLRPRACAPSTSMRATRSFSHTRAALAIIAEMQDLQISRAHQTLQIGAADMEMARHLGIAINRRPRKRAASSPTLTASSSTSARSPIRATAYA